MASERASEDRPSPSPSPSLSNASTSAASESEPTRAQTDELESTDSTTDTVYDADGRILRCAADNIFPVARISAHRYARGRIQYLVYWVGYSETTWEPLDHVKECEALKAYHATLKTPPPPKKLRKR